MIYVSCSLLALWFLLKCVCSCHTFWVIQRLCYQQMRFWHLLPVKCPVRKRKTREKQDISSVQSFNRFRRLFVTPKTAECQDSLFFIISPSLPKLKSTESVMSSNHLIVCCPLLFLPSIFPSIWVFSNESALQIRWPKYWSFNFSISPSNEHSGLISFRIDWLDLLAVQETLKRLLQPHSSKISILGAQPSLWSNNSHIHTWLLEKSQLWLDGPLSENNVFAF